MAGLRKILKAYGEMNVNGVVWVWDYTKDEPRKKAEMSKAEIKASEKAKFALIKSMLKN